MKAWAIKGPDGIVSLCMHEMETRRGSGLVCVEVEATEAQPRTEYVPRSVHDRRKQPSAEAVSVAWRHATDSGWVVTKERHADSEPLYAAPPAAGMVNDKQMLMFLRTCASPAFDREDIRKEAELMLAARPK